MTYGGRRRITFLRAVPTTKPFSRSRCCTGAGLAVELDAPDQARAAHVDDRPGTAAPAPRASAPNHSPVSATRATSPPSTSSVEDREAEAAGDRVAAEGRAVVARLHEPVEPRPGQDGAEREPAAERLGERHDVGHDARPPGRRRGGRSGRGRTGSRRRRGPRPVASQSSRAARRNSPERDDPSLALDRLEEDRRRRRRRPPPSAPRRRSAGTNVTPGTSGSNGSR